MRRKQFPTLFEKLSAFNKSALITSEIPEGVHPYFISLSDDAVQEALSFATTAVLAYQYEKYGQVLNETDDQGAAAAAAIAATNIQEIAYQLMVARKANFDGTAMPGLHLSLEMLTCQEAAEQGLPVKPESKPDDPYLFLIFPIPEDGQDGAPGPAGPAGPAGPSGQPDPYHQPPNDNSAGGVIDACLANPVVLYQNVPGVLAGDIGIQTLGADMQSIRGGIDGLISSLEPGYKPARLRTVSLAFSGWGCTSLAVRGEGMPGIPYRAASVRVGPSDGAHQDVAIPGSENAGWSIGPVGMNFSTVWYRDEFTLGGEGNKIASKDIKLDYRFWLGPGIGDPNVPHEPDNAVKMWLTCYSFDLLACGPGTDYICQPGSYPASDAFFRSHVAPGNQYVSYYTQADYPWIPDDQQIYMDPVGAPDMYVTNNLWNDIDPGSHHVKIDFHCESTADTVGIAIYANNGSWERHQDGIAGVYNGVVTYEFDLEFTGEIIDEPFSIKLARQGGGAALRFNRLTVTVS